MHHGLVPVIQLVSSTIDKQQFTMVRVMLMIVLSRKAFKRQSICTKENKEVSGLVPREFGFLRNPTKPECGGARNLILQKEKKKSIN